MLAQKHHYAKQYSRIKSEYLGNRGGGLADRIPLVADVRRLFRLSREGEPGLIKSHLSQIPKENYEVRGHLDLITNVCFLLDIPEEQLPEEIIENIRNQKYSREPFYRRIIEVVENFEAFGRRAQVWYKQYWMEDIWDMDVEDFCDEYRRMHYTRESVRFFWANVLNILRLLCRIKSCNYYMVSHEPIVTFPSGAKLISIEDSEHECKNIDSEFINHYKYGETHLSIQNFDLEVWRRYKDVLLESAIGALDCTYSSMTNLYSTLIEFMFQNDFQTHQRFMVRGFGNFFWRDESKLDSRIKSVDGLFMYLSLIWPKAASLARTEPTLLIPTTIEPTRTVDGRFMTHLNRIDHDWDSHYVVSRKRGFKRNRIEVLDSLQDFKSMVKILKEGDPNLETLQVITYLFNEVLKQSTPFSRKNLALLISQHITSGRTLNRSNSEVRVDSILFDGDTKRHIIRFLQILQDRYLTFDSRILEFIEAKHVDEKICKTEDEISTVSYNGIQYKPGDIIDLSDLVQDSLSLEVKK